MSTEIPPLQPAAPASVYAASQRSRTVDLVVTGLLGLWTLVAGGLWLAGQTNWFSALGALLLTIAGCLKTYGTFTSRLTLSADGIECVIHGATYFARWDSVRLSPGGWRWPAGSLIPSQPIPPSHKSAYGRLMGALPAAAIPLRMFGWPSAALRADLERYAPHLLKSP